MVILPKGLWRSSCWGLALLTAGNDFLYVYLRIYEQIQEMI